MDPRARMTELVEQLLHHQRLYYVCHAPRISDLEYDRLFDELRRLEERYPQFVLPDSPARRVGSDLDGGFPERAHTAPVLSLEKVYDTAALEGWAAKLAAALGQPPDFTVEEKLDGVSIVLYYRDGLLDAALTRGNGLIGNDVTASVRTLRQVPLRIAAPGEVAVRGEIYLERGDFDRFNAEFENRYANPRNLASGSLRSVSPAQVARVPLHLFVYEGHFAAETAPDHLEALRRLRDLGFPVNPALGFFSASASQRRRAGELFAGCRSGDSAEMDAYIAEQVQTRRQRPYDIDGLVVKVNDLAARSGLGATSHHPRWAMAFKFDAPLARTRLREVVVQVGRNGRVTPVAILDPVPLSGSVVARATLHNQDTIDALELGVGDEVSISKRGDVIPAVEEVLEKDPVRPSVFRLPADCPFCRRALVRQGGHHFCPNEQCPERVRRAIVHFVARDGMDIESLGEQTVAALLARGWLRDVADLYEFDWDRLRELDGFRDKKIGRIRESVERSKRQPFPRVLVALGLEGVGQAAAAALVEHGFDTMDKIVAAAARGDREAFAQVEGVGDVLAGLLVAHFAGPRLQGVIGRLRRAGLQMAAPAEPKRRAGGPFAGQVWVISGRFEHFQPRSRAADEIIRRGGRVASAVSAHTTRLLAGQAAGAKLKQAQRLGVPVVSEEEFLKLLAPG